MNCHFKHGKLISFLSLFIISKNFLQISFSQWQLLISNEIIFYEHAYNISAHSSSYMQYNIPWDQAKGSAWIYSVYIEIWSCSCNKCIQKIWYRTWYIHIWYLSTVLNMRNNYVKFLISSIEPEMQPENKVNSVHVRAALQVDYVCLPSNVLLQMLVFSKSLSVSSTLCCLLFTYYLWCFNGILVHKLTFENLRKTISTILHSTKHTIYITTYNQEVKNVDTIFNSYEKSFFITGFGLVFEL